MNFAEQIKAAQDSNINIAMLSVAYEVKCVHLLRIHTPRFEDICKAVYNLWLETDHIEINQLVCALKDGIETQDCTLDDVLAYGESWDLVIDLACQCTY